MLGRRFQQNVVDDHEAIKRLGNWHYLQQYPELNAYKGPLPLSAYEYSVFSQNGEDGILLYLLSQLGVENHFMVEIGIEDGRECNSANLSLNFGWRAALFEGSKLWADKATEYYKDVLNGDQRVSVTEGLVTPANINNKMRTANVPEQIDVLSIDIDSFDYWLWQAFDHTRPSIVIMEYNASFGPEWSVTIPHPDDYKKPDQDVTYYHGASISALNHLAEEKGYCLLGCDSKGINAFFVLKEKAEVVGFQALSSEQAFRPHYWRTRAHSLEEQAAGLKNALLVEVG